ISEIDLFHVSDLLRAYSAETNKGGRVFPDKSPRTNTMRFVASQAPFYKPPSSRLVADTTNGIPHDLRIAKNLRQCRHVTQGQWPDQHSCCFSNHFHSHLFA